MVQSLVNEEAVKEYLEEIGEKKFRLAQINQALYGDLTEEIEGMTTLSKDLREKFAQKFTVQSLELVSDQVSKDGTNKALFKTHDGNYIETVMMRHLGGRISLCVSSQIGCPVKCTFCATGTLGYTRNLDFVEIVEQVLFFNKKLKKEDKRVRNIIFMGMGEPLLNYDNVMKAISIMNDQKKLCIGVRHITISTSGVIPKIKALIDEKVPVNLAVSLHAPNDTLRTKLMPINNAYPLKDLIEVLGEYSTYTGKRIFYEYVMLHKVNDDISHAAELASLLKGQWAHVNLIPYNPAGSKDVLSCSSRQRILKFQNILQMQDIPCTVRVTLGQDIDAACGQLAAKQS